MFTRATIRCLAAVMLIWLGICSAGWLGTAPACAAGETVENRRNLWPFFYYQYPEMSVLWPISRFDFEEKDHRIFPVYWGEDHFVVFPEIWWLEDSRGVLPVFWGEDHFVVAPVVWWFDETKSIFPAWLHSESEDGHDTWVFWPVFRWKQQGDDRGVHLWPLAGAYEDGDERYRFALWPLCHDWRDGQNSLTVTPLWSAGVEDGARWDMLFPLYYRSSNPATGASPFARGTPDRRTAGGVWGRFAWPEGLIPQGL